MIISGCMTAKEKSMDRNAVGLAFPEKDLIGEYEGTGIYKKAGTKKSDSITASMYGYIENDILMFQEKIRYEKSGRQTTNTYRININPSSFTYGCTHVETDTECQLKRAENRIILESYELVISDNKTRTVNPRQVYHVMDNGKIYKVTTKDKFSYIFSSKEEITYSKTK
jgi:hypothetical protein